MPKVTYGVLTTLGAAALGLGLFQGAANAASDSCVRDAAPQAGEVTQGERDIAEAEGRLCKLMSDAGPRSQDDEVESLRRLVPGT